MSEDPKPERPEGVSLRPRMSPSKTVCRVCGALPGDKCTGIKSMHYARQKDARILYHTKLDIVEEYKEKLAAWEKRNRPQEDVYSELVDRAAWYLITGSFSIALAAIFKGPFRTDVEHAQEWADSIVRARRRKDVGYGVGRGSR